MSDNLRRARRIGLESWESDRQMAELNESLARQARREVLAARIADETYGSDDVEVSTPDDNRGVIAVEYCDEGYWVSARIWVDAEAVEDRLNKEA